MFISAQGVLEHRFTNVEVPSDTKGVLTANWQALHRPQQPSPTAPQAGGGAGCAHRRIWAELHPTESGADRTPRQRQRRRLRIHGGASFARRGLPLEIGDQPC
jgi:hypothetical protein